MGLRFLKLAKKEQTIAIRALGNVCMALACIIWGLMSPLGKDAMQAGIPGTTMVTLRVVGGTLCFWLTSLYVHREHVPLYDVMKLCGAAMFAIVANQCCFTIGLSITSPVDASLMTTLLPVFTMILAIAFTREHINIKMGFGLVFANIGAVWLILANNNGQYGSGAVLGDLLCIGAQISFAIYLTMFKNIILRYSVFTLMKWMMLFAALVITPFTFNEVISQRWSEYETNTLLETAFVVFCGTYLAYILSVKAQKMLKPTNIAMYNYVQPIVATIVGVILGIATFGYTTALPMILIFIGVWLVNRKQN